MAKIDNQSVSKALENQGVKPENTANRQNKINKLVIGQAKGRMEVQGKEPGFHYAWINDYNLDEYLDMGFEHVTHSVKVGTKRIGAAAATSGDMAVFMPAGAGVTAYLLRIPQEFYDAAMKQYHKRVDESEESIRAQISNKGLQGTLEIARKPQSE